MDSFWAPIFSEEDQEDGRWKEGAEKVLLAVVELDGCISTKVFQVLFLKAKIQKSPLVAISFQPFLASRNKSDKSQNEFVFGNPTQCLPPLPSLYSTPRANQSHLPISPLCNGPRL